LRTYRFGTVVPFVLIHLGAAGVFFVPFSWRWVGLAALTLWVRMFGVTAGYHRYFSHRSYRLGRVAQFLLACLAQSSGQKGILWWAALHRDHHRYSDLEEDIHPPWQRGFWWSHAGWVLSNEHDTYDPKRIADFSRFPELRWLDRHHWIPTTALAVAIMAWGGPAFVWGYLLSTVLLYHFTFAINSLAHIVGTRRFDTPDHSRNNFLLALVTLGEGWHNNHHFSMNSCRQGYRWWEVDITYAVLKALSLVGIARDLRPFRSPGRPAREAA
jgi:stearoyl-CoA desaturase (delta-9 desaturase)